ncbi:GNAT family N-acetyltransferase [Paraglaciecola sp. 20A4]|uniref:tRNA(Met) cytidine acetyltransferase TmcA n=1 Tax=Paraglaciecola sp. 20A4 TaxID=2687288 RepID=UPI001408A24F|nr:GNAT family N-acetyltransferase [Paraglaciecola sp. 20A4]
MDLHFKIQDWLKARKNHLCHRQLVVISGAENWSQRLSKEIIAVAEIPEEKLLWVGNRLGSTLNVDCHTYRQHLGTEYNALVYNMYTGLSANALMAFSGTIMAGGIMILICPEFARWPVYPDPLASKRSSYGCEQSLHLSHFTRRLISLIKNDLNTIIITPEEMSGHNAHVPQEDIGRKLNSSTPEQQTLITSILKMSDSHKDRPLVITADRGRGKSSALGLAARELIKKKSKKIIITAPNKRNVEHVFAFAKSSLLTQDSTSTNVPLAFVAPDALLAAPHKADLLFIDEAAAIPASILKALLNKFPRVVMSSTVHGYEGAGRGFELRFKPYLEKNKKGWKAFTLTMPIRWYKNDCLEAFWFHCFMMEDITSCSTDKHITAIPEAVLPIPLDSIIANTEAHNVIEVSRAQLVDDPILLHQTFSLLVNAHYQTSPDDLVRLLDAPEQRLFTYTLNSKVVGVALINEEGGDELSKLSALITRGDRRVNGHLVAQNLALHTANQAFCRMKQWRVVRIAVDKRQRRNNIGSALLNTISESAKNEGVELLTSSFGASENLLNFWTQNIFSPLKLGFKRDAASDEVSMIVGLALSAYASTLVSKLRDQFARELHYYISRYHRMTNTALLTRLLTHCKSEPLTVDEKHQIACFLESKNPFGTFSQVLAKYLLMKLSSVKTSSEIPIGTDLLVASLLQFKPTETLITEFNLSGKKALNKHIRLALIDL